MLRFLAATVPLALCACAVGPDYREPDLAVPEAWSEADAGDASAELEAWWARFGDPTLTSLVERALDGNLELRIADARVREAAALRRVAGASLWPQLNGVLEGETEAWPAGTLDSALGALEATWEIDVFGGTRRALEAARADHEASVAERRALVVLLLGEIARTYIELRGFEALEDTVARNLATQRETSELTEAQRRAGLASDLDVQRARALLASTAAEVPTIGAARRASAHRLAVLLGQQPTALNGELQARSPVPSVEEALVVGVPADLLRRRPDLARAERALAAETARVGVAVADFYPRFTLNGSVGLRSETVKNLFGADAGFAAIGPNIAWPIFAAGRLRANAAAASAGQERALAEYELVLLEACEDVENAIVRHTREQLRRRSLREAVEANREAAELARRLYANGLGAFLDVLDAERSVLISESRLVESETAVSTSLVALYVALGGGWQRAEELRAS